MALSYKKLWKLLIDEEIFARVLSLLDCYGARSEILQKEREG